MTTPLTLTDQYEETLALALEAVLARWADLLEALGPRPFGWSAGRGDDVLEAWLDLRDDSAQWTALLQGYTLQVGAKVALVKVVTDATALEKQLARAGLWDGTQEDIGRAQVAGATVVRQRQMTRRLGMAAQAMAATEKELAMPAPWLTPALPVVDPVAEMTGQPSAPAQPLPQPPMPMLPPLGAGAPPQLPVPAPFGPPQQVGMPPGVPAGMG